MTISEIPPSSPGDDAGVLSSGNSSSALLDPAATFPGAWEDVTKYSSISIICVSDEIGTLHADFSTDGGVTTDRTIQLSSGLTADMGIHNLIAVATHFKVRLINGGTIQGTLALQVIYNKHARIAQPTSRMAQGLSQYTDVLNARAVLTDETGSNNVAISNLQAIRVIPPQEARTAFGEAIVAQPHPVIQIKAPYGVNDLELEVHENNAGTVTNGDSQLAVSSGASANSEGSFHTQEVISYKPGQGINARYTALFTTGVSGNIQAAGIGSYGDFLAVGFNGTAFGIRHKHGGSPEVRTLTVTTKSTTAENITITLDGVADATVAVTDATATDVTTTANEIAAHDYSDIGNGWHASAYGDTVVFLAWADAAKTGTYTLSGATTAIGTFAQSVVGVAATDTWVAQASWNGADIFDGNGPTGVTLDPTKGNVYQIKFQYLGYGAIEFFIEDPNDGELHLIHVIAYANANVLPSMLNPSFPLRVESINAANTSDIVVKTASMAAFIEGEHSYLGLRAGFKALANLATANETPILTIGVKLEQNGVVNQTKLKAFMASVAVDHTKPVTINFYKNATLTGASFADYDTDSGLQEDTAATAFTNGTFLFAIPLGKAGNAVLNLPESITSSDLNPGDTLTITAEPVSGTGADVIASLYVVELA